jgi:hypothetical protein
MLGSARQLRLRPAAVAFALGETIELQHDADVIRQQRDLDPAAQTAQAQCDYRLAQLGRAGDVSALVEGDADLKPLV